MSGHTDVKQVIVVRRDLHMRQGKAVAQGAHAVSMFWISTTERDLTAVEVEWLACGMPKICVRVESESELQGIIERCRCLDIQCFPVTDAGHTEFHGTPTLTCCAIGPDWAKKIDTITGELKLL